MVDDRVCLVLFDDEGRPKSLTRYAAILSIARHGAVVRILLQSGAVVDVQNANEVAAADLLHKYSQWVMGEFDGRTIKA